MPSLKVRERKSSPIGVDIGETGVRAAQVTANSGLYTVTHTARCERRRQTPVVGRSDTDHADHREAPAD